MSIIVDLKKTFQHWRSQLDSFPSINNLNIYIYIMSEQGQIQLKQRFEQELSVSEHTVSIPLHWYVQSHHVTPASIILSLSFSPFSNTIATLTPTVFSRSLFSLMHLMNDLMMRLILNQNKKWSGASCPPPMKHITHFTA